MFSSCSVRGYGVFVRLRLVACVFFVFRVLHFSVFAVARRRGRFFFVTFVGLARSNGGPGKNVWLPRIFFATEKQMGYSHFFFRRATMDEKRR